MSDADPIPTTSLLKAIAGLNSRVAPVFRKTIEKHLGEPVRCAGLCAFCCYQKIVCSLADAVPVYLYLKEHGEWTPEFAARLEIADKELTASTHRGWLSKRRPCVLLRETSFGQGSCIAYPVRPLSCVATFSVSDPPLCADGSLQTQLAVQDNGVSEWLAQVGNKILAALDQPRVEFFTLPGALLYAHALAEELPLPSVFKLGFEEARRQGVSVETLFDRQAAPAPAAP